MSEPTIIRPQDVTPFTRYALDPWQLFVDKRVWTLRKDYEGDEGKRQLFPADEYVWHLIRLWQEKHPVQRAHPEWGIVRNGRVRFPYQGTKKSRRVRYTWLMSICHMWKALTTHGVDIGVGSVTFNLSNDVLKDKMMYFFRQLDPEVFDGRVPVVEHIEGMIRIPEMDSRIVAFQQGDDVFRSYTFSDVMLDEVAFWPRFTETLGGARPASDKITMFSSSEEGSGWKSYYQDREDQEEAA